jgi:hypothetical protein
VKTKTASLRQFIIWTLILIAGSSVHAQEIEPRSYAVVPTGLHATALSYTFSKGDVITPGNSPVQNLDVTNNVFNLGYVQTFTFFTKLARVAVSMPFGFLNGSASFQGTDTSGSRTGFYDGRIKFGMNLFGSPALAPKDFQKFQEHTVFGASVVISVPLGQYYPSKLINLGSNRWGFKPELGISHREGRLFYEIYSGVWMYTKNTNYFKSYIQQQNSLFSFQAHVDYTFQHGKYLALNGGYADGGETSLNAIEQNDQQENWRGGITFSSPIFNRHQSVKIMVNTGIATKAGQNYTALTIVYQYSWY